MLRLTNVIFLENRSKRVLCANGILPPFAVPHVKPHRRQKHFADRPEQACPLCAREGRKPYEIPETRREQGKYHIFDPLVSPPLKKGEQLKIRLV